MLWTLERFGPLWIEITFKSCDENLNENDISKGRKSSFLDKLWRTSLKLPATPQTSLKRSVSIEVMLFHCNNLGRYGGNLLSRLKNGNNPGTKRRRRRGWWSSQKERQEQAIPPVPSINRWSSHQCPEARAEAGKATRLLFQLQPAWVRNGQTRWCYNWLNLLSVIFVNISEIDGRFI